MDSFRLQLKVTVVRMMDYETDQMVKQLMCAGI